MATITNFIVDIINSLINIIGPFIVPAIVIILLVAILIDFKHALYFYFAEKKIKEKKVESKGLTREFVKEAESAHDLDSLLSYQAGKLDSKLNIPRVLAPIPVLLGLLGTVLGISQSISGMSSLSQQNITVEILSVGLTNIFSGLNTAFYTTLAGILVTIIVLFFNSITAHLGNKFWQSYYPIAQAIHKRSYKETDIRKELYYLNAKSLEKLSASHYEIRNFLKELNSIQKENSRLSCNVQKSIEGNLYRIHEIIDSRDRLLETFSESIQSSNDKLLENLRSLNDTLHKIQLLIEEELPKDLNKKSEEPLSLATLTTPKYFSKGAWTRSKVYVYSKFVIEEIMNKIQSDNELKVAGEAQIVSNISKNTFVNLKITPEKAIEIGQREGILLTLPKTEIDIELKPNDQINVKYPIAANLILIDKNTGVEIVAIPFTMTVKDYITDHISRPFIQTFIAASSFITGVILLGLEIISTAKPNFKMSIGGVSLITIAAILQKLKNQKYIDLSKNFLSP